jgi:hypothetical protein
LGVGSGPLSRERNCRHSCESLIERRQRVEVGVERDPFDSGDAKPRAPVLVPQLPGRPDCAVTG